MIDGLNGAGCVGDKDPWGVVWSTSMIDLPGAKRLMELEVGNILRGQKPDGSWGDGGYDAWSMSSVKVYEGLVRHGLFEQLRKLPPLPPEWRIVREIPAPDGDRWSMTWDGESLWVLDKDGCEAIAVSPEDGSIRKSVKIPFEKPMGIGWWDDGLGVTQNGPKRLVKLDVDTGDIMQELAVDKPEWCEVYDFAKVNGELWVSDGFNGLIRKVDPSGENDPQFFGPAGPEPMVIAEAPGGVWHVDAFAPAIIKTSLDGKLLEFGEKPFGESTTGIAHDGENLWALDNGAKRICVIERASE